MNTAVAEKQSSSFQTIQRATTNEPILVVNGADAIFIRAGTEFAFANGTVGFEKDFPVTLPILVAGADYYIRISAANDPVAFMADGLPPADAIGGFHYAPGGNAAARAGGDETPAINTFSCWDAGFRPACPDPRGMALVRQDELRFWCDIYLLGVDHLAKGTSRFGMTIADGADLPAAIDGKGKVKRCDFPTVQAIYAHHGKQLLTYDEFRAAAFGVMEKSAAEDEPETTGLDAARTSRFGIMQATGNMWVWGTDGDPDEPRPSFFGGSWFDRSDAGSRYALLGLWPDGSHGYISARGRSDHLRLA
jgi:hypothetical protein